MTAARDRPPGGGSPSWEEEQRLLGVGVRLRRRADVPARHGAEIAAAAAALAGGARDPVADEVARRLAALRARLWRAPGWLRRLRAAGLSPDDLGALDDLAAWPLLERDEYGARWTELFDADGADPELHLATSSGTTGQALLAPRSGYDGVHMWAVLRFWIAHLGVELPPRPRLVLLCTLPSGLEYSVRAPQFGGGALHRVSTVRPRPDERLRRARPAVLSTDPAGLHWLVGRPAPPRPRLVLSSAQHLAPSLRAEAARVLGAPIVNYYATTETGPIAWECLVEAGRFHVLHPDVWVESVGGRVAVTRLRDSPLPLVRYLPGDRADVVDGRCACGTTGRSLVGFTGREACAFLTPSGREVDAWALSWLFKDVPLVRFELCQIGAERFALRVEAPGGGGAELPGELALLAERLARVLARMGFEAPTVALERVTGGSLAAKPRPFARAWPGP